MLVSHWHFLSVVTGLFLANIFPALGQEFPDGPGKQVVTAVCGGCHDINRIRIGYTPEGWRTVVRMMQNVETPVLRINGIASRNISSKASPSDRDPPPSSSPGLWRRDQGMDRCRRQVRARMIPLATGTAQSGGPASWPTSSAGSIQRPARSKEYDLKTPHTGPHGLIEDKDGNIWFTGNTAGVDRQARSEDRRGHRVSECPIPRRRTRTLSFSIATAYLWFTRTAGQHGWPARSSDR